MQQFWSEARFVLENLVRCTWNIDSDGVELKFTTGPTEVQGRGDKSHDLQAFNSAMQHSDATPTPKTVTDMSIKLHEILSSWLQKYKSARKYGHNPKFMTVIVLTDGVWDGMRSNPFAVDQVIID